MEMTVSYHQGSAPIWCTLPLASRISCCAGSGMAPSHCPSPLSTHTMWRTAQRASCFPCLMAPRQTLPEHSGNCI